MLNKPEAEVVYDESGVAKGVKAKDEEGKLVTAKAKYVVGDPSYFKNKVEKVKAIHYYLIWV